MIKANRHVVNVTRLPKFGCAKEEVIPNCCNRRREGWVDRGMEVPESALDWADAAAPIRSQNRGRDRLSLYVLNPIWYIA